MRCDLCGKEENLVKALIEGTELNVCSKCASFGQILKQTPHKRLNNHESSTSIPISKHPITMDIGTPKFVEFIKDDINFLIKRKREKLGLKQEELAKKMAVKESVIHNIESGHFMPSISLAKKIGKFLRIELIEVVKDEKVEKPSNLDGRKITLGDLIKIKMRKKK